MTDLSSLMNEASWPDGPSDLPFHYSKWSVDHAMRVFAPFNLFLLLKNQNKKSYCETDSKKISKIFFKKSCEVEFYSKAKLILNSSRTLCSVEQLGIINGWLRTTSLAIMVERDRNPRGERMR